MWRLINLEHSELKKNWKIICRLWNIVQFQGWIINIYTPYRQSKIKLSVISNSVTSTSCDFNIISRYPISCINNWTSIQFILVWQTMNKEMITYTTDFFSAVGKVPIIHSVMKPSSRTPMRVSWCSADALTCFSMVFWMSSKATDDSECSLNLVLKTCRR